ncbi:MAG: DNA double-strand break repair nuclease NurA [Thermoproteota archaeon]
MASTESAWSRLPIDLQEQFYEKAEEEARKLREVILEFKSTIEREKSKITPYIRRLVFRSEGEKSIAAVDGSFSPRPTETVGARFSVYSAGFLMVRGGKIISEGYFPGSIRYEQYSSRELFSASLHVQEARLEREAALKALEHEPDLLILDGSFLSFAYSMFRIIRIMPEVPKWIRKTVSDTFEMTEKLMKSGKCVGVVKRGRSRAIGGWLSLEEGRMNPLIRHLDKQVLNNLMSTPSLLDYREFLNEPGLERVYSRVSDLLSRGEFNDPKYAFIEARKRTVKSLAKALEISEEGAQNLVSSIGRLQVKISKDNPPFELEVPVNSYEYIVETLFSSMDNFNTATGLPIAIDLIDGSVTLPAEFTREFVREVEARVAKMYEGNLDEVREFFTNMNPQKEL